MILDGAARRAALQQARLFASALPVAAWVGRTSRRRGRDLALTIALLGVVAAGAGCALDEPGGSRDGAAARPLHSPALEPDPDEGATEDGLRAALDGGGGARRSRDSGRSGLGALVVRVVDGDTVEVSVRGRIVDVRLIGVDTPETVHPSRPVECFGPEASAFTRGRLEGERVVLEFDVERRDTYGRTLAYVWLDERMFNRTLVRAGFAQVSTYPPNVRYVGRFRAAQRAARSADAGLWGARCRNEAAGGVPGRSGASGSSSGRGCDPNYRGACVPRYPPDRDCSDAGAADFESVGSDPHGFDGDGDGIACEA